MVTRRRILPPRYLALRALWNDFDPLGILGRCPDWDEREYDAYLGDTMDLLDAGDGDGLLSFVRGTCRFVIGDRHGLRRLDEGRGPIDHEGFVQALLAWHASEGEPERFAFADERAGGALDFVPVEHIVRPPERLPRTPRGRGGTPVRSTSRRHACRSGPDAWDMDGAFDPDGAGAAASSRTDDGAREP